MTLKSILTKLDLVHFLALCFLNNIFNIIPQYKATKVQTEL
jgi:hypothetical protein